MIIIRLKYVLFFFGGLEDYVYIIYVCIDSRKTRSFFSEFVFFSDVFGCLVAGLVFINNKREIYVYIYMNWLLFLFLV